MITDLPKVLNLTGHFSNSTGPSVASGQIFPVIGLLIGCFFDVHIMCNHYTKDLI